MFTNQIPLESAREKLAASGNEFLSLFSYGSLEVELYQPDTIDRQQSHDRDEVYVVVAGRGKFEYDGAFTDFQPGDLLFVPAGVEHRFHDFSPDFCTWVIFFGSQVGEK